ncbi:MAG: sigma-70 family RNA polymerase sigma factor [Clostridia bacterium]|nr:sigma-70 family RNA polymerase sigma factor [Clostridia bacterium]
MTAEERIQTPCPEGETPTEKDVQEAETLFESDSVRNERNRQLIYEAQREDESVSERALDLLVRENTGLVRSLALRFCGRGTDYEDLIQIGTIGMIKAIRSFDLGRGTAFSTYAVPLIVGEIRRHLRDDGIIKVSRSYRKLGAQLLRLSSEISAREEREPSVRELAAFCGVAPEEAVIALDAISPVRSLYDPLPGTSHEDAQSYDAVLPDEDSTDELERIKDRLALTQAIAKMQPMWQKIVLLRYYRNHTQQQVADALGLTQVKVSREEKKIVAFLKEELTS